MGVLPTGSLVGRLGGLDFGLLDELTQRAWVVGGGGPSDVDLSGLACHAVPSAPGVVFRFPVAFP